MCVVCLESTTHFLISMFHTENWVCPVAVDVFINFWDNQQRPSHWTSCFRIRRAAQRKINPCAARMYQKATPYRCPVRSLRCVECTWITPGTTFSNRLARVPESAPVRSCPRWTNELHSGVTPGPWPGHWSETTLVATVTRKKGLFVQVQQRTPSSEQILRSLIPWWYIFCHEQCYTSCKSCFRFPRVD